MDDPQVQRDDRQERVDRQFHEDAAYWNDVYSSESLEGRIYRDRQERVLQLVERVQLPLEALVLDAGCGAGLLTAALAQRHHRVIAVDSVDRMVELTRRRVEELSLDERVSVRLGDINALDLADGAVDVALVVGLLPWVRSPERALAELARVLRPGGHLVVTTDNPARVSYLLDPRLNPYLEPARKVVKVLVGRPGGPAEDDVHSFTHPRELNLLLHRAGFRKRVGTSVGFAPLSFWGSPRLRGRTGRGLNRMLQWFADRGTPFIRSIGAHYIVLAQKR